MKTLTLLPILILLQIQLTVAGTIYTNQESLPLPVTWLSFTAKQSLTEVKLNWITGTEVNTKYFVVQHSTDGYNWSDLGTIAAAEYSTRIIDYSFVHKNPMAGKNYYRIAERENDGFDYFSRIIGVNVAEKVGFTVHPNPSNNNQTVVDLPANAMVRIYDNFGRLRFEKQLSAGHHPLDLSALNKGIYYLVSGENKRKLILE